MNRLTTEMLDPYAKQKHYTLVNCPAECSKNCYSCKVLMEALDLLGAYENREMTPEEIDSQKELTQAYKNDCGEIQSTFKTHISLDTPIDDLDLSIRAWNCLNRAGYNTIQQLLRADDDDLMRVRNLGQKCFDEVKEKLQKYKE